MHAQASSTSSMARYIGLRVHRKTPLVTSAVLASGFSGLTVVFARRKPSTADSPMTSATIKKTAAMTARPGSVKSSAGKAISHITSAHAAITTGGGIRCSRSRDRDVSLGERVADRLRERGCARLVAVQAERVGGYRDALSGKAGDVALLDHRERLAHRFRLVFDHAARLVARRERAVVGIAAVREHFAGDGNAGAFRDLKVFAVGKHI